MEKTFVPGTNHWGDKYAVEAYLRARRDGMPAGITEFGRTWETQMERYKAYQAGTGNFARHPDDPLAYHVSGNAIDVPRNKADDYDTTTPAGWLRVNGAPYGFYEVNNEKWHFNYFMNRDQYLGTPINPAYQEDDVSYAIKVDGKHLFQIAPGFVKHFTDATVADLTMKITSADDQWIALTGAQFLTQLDSFGVPRNVVDATNGGVVSPGADKPVLGGMWSWSRSADYRLLTLSVSTPVVEVDYAKITESVLNGIAERMKP